MDPPANSLTFESRTQSHYIRFSSKKAEQPINRTPQDAEQQQQQHPSSWNLSAHLKQHKEQHRSQQPSRPSSQSLLDVASGESNDVRTVSFQLDRIDPSDDCETDSGNVYSVVVSLDDRLDECRDDQEAMALSRRNIHQSYQPFLSQHSIIIPSPHQSDTATFHSHQNDTRRRNSPTMANRRFYHHQSLVDFSLAALTSLTVVSAFAVLLFVAQKTPKTSSASAAAEPSILFGATWVIYLAMGFPLLLAPYVVYQRRKIATIPMQLKYLLTNDQGCSQWHVSHLLQQQEHLHHQKQVVTQTLRDAKVLVQRDLQRVTRIVIDNAVKAQQQQRTTGTIQDPPTRVTFHVGTFHKLVYRHAKVQTQLQHQLQLRDLRRLLTDYFFDTNDNTQNDPVGNRVSNNKEVQLQQLLIRLETFWKNSQNTMTTRQNHNLPIGEKRLPSATILRKAFRSVRQQPSHHYW